MKQKAQWVAVGAIVAVISGLLGAGLAFTPDLFLVAEGSDAPDFKAARLTTGDTITLADFEGEVVLLNIWATWCGPCVWEMPALQRLHEALGNQGLRVVAVSVDDAIDREGVLEWVTERNLTFTHLHDRSGRIERDYQTTGLPETFLIDRYGVIIRKVIGAAEWDEPVQTAPIRRLLGLSEVPGEAVLDADPAEADDAS